METEMPGATANGTLRVAGVLTLAASVIVGLWILIEFGTLETRSPWGGTSTEANIIGLAMGLAVMIQGVLVAALFIALAGIGDNIIAIRLHTAPDRPLRAGDPSGKSAGAAARVRVCQYCGTNNDLSYWKCQECGASIRDQPIVDRHLDDAVQRDPPVQVRCPNCRAVTSVPEGVEIVRCAKCDRQLQVPGAAS